MDSADKEYRRLVYYLNHLNENKSLLKVVEGRGKAQKILEPVSASETKEPCNPRAWYTGKLKKYWNKKIFKEGRDRLVSEILLATFLLRNNKTEEAERLRFRIKWLWRLRNHRRGIWQERRTLTSAEKINLRFKENTRVVTREEYEKRKKKTMSKQNKEKPSH